MTPAQVVLFAGKAAKRRAEAILSDAHTAAIGASVGMTGKTKPLKQLAKTLGLDYGKSTQGGVEAMLTTLARDAGARVEDKRGSDSRRAERQARREHARIPRRSQPR